MALTTSPQSLSTGPVRATLQEPPVTRKAVRTALASLLDAVRPAPVHVLTTRQLVAGLALCVGVTAIAVALLALVLR